MIPAPIEVEAINPTLVVHIAFARRGPDNVAR